MKRAEIIARLRSVAERLASAPDRTMNRAREVAASNKHAFQAGALEQVCRTEASTIESLLAQLEAA